MKTLVDKCEQSFSGSPCKNQMNFCKNQKYRPIVGPILFSLLNFGDYASLYYVQITPKMVCITPPKLYAMAKKCALVCTACIVWSINQANLHVERKGFSLRPLAIIWTAF
jgi:hypothetical protein